MSQSSELWNDNSYSERDFVEVVKQFEQTVGCCAAGLCVSMETRASGGGGVQQQEDKTRTYPISDSPLRHPNQCQLNIIEELCINDAIKQ